MNCSDVSEDKLNNKLLESAESGKCSMAKCLLQRSGIDVNAHNDEGFTALHWAAQKGIKY